VIATIQEDGEVLFFQHRSSLVDLLINLRNIAIEYSLNHEKGFEMDSRHLEENIYYIRENVPVFGVESIKKVIFAFSENAHVDSEIYRIVVVIIGSVSLVIPVIVTIIQYIENVYEIKKHRKSEFISFLMVDHGFNYYFHFSSLPGLIFA
jgi:hypothetical protein